MEWSKQKSGTGILNEVILKAHKCTGGNGSYIISVLTVLCVNNGNGSPYFLAQRLETKFGEEL